MQKALWVAGSENLANWPEGLGVRMVVALLLSTLFLWLAHRIFGRLQGNFAQEL
jgi:ABC-2 type transport system permease protein